jgi:hypothetical protein
LTLGALGGTNSFVIISNSKMVLAGLFKSLACVSM